MEFSPEWSYVESFLPGWSEVDRRREGARKEEGGRRKEQRKPEKRTRET